jgi:hypothetical protein
MNKQSYEQTKVCLFKGMIKQGDKQKDVLKKTKDKWMNIQTLSYYNIENIWSTIEELHSLCNVASPIVCCQHLEQNNYLPDTLV